MAAGDSRSQASGTSPGPQSGGPGPAEALGPVSFYALLQLAEDASLEELRQAFRRQSKRLHPDTTSLPAALAQDSFRQLRQAYVTLLDPERRRAYDASLAVARAGLGLRPSPGAQGSAPAGAAAGRAAGINGPGIRPTQAAGEVPGMGPIPGAASRQSNGGPGVPGSGANGLGGNGLGGNGLGAPGLGSRGLGVGDGLPKPDSVRRTLSGGEWFALLLLGLALVFCLVLGVGLAWLRGTELVREPSWWPAQESLQLSQPAPVAPSRPQPPPSQPIPSPLPSPLPSLPQPQPPSAPLQPPGPLTAQPSTWPSSQASRALSSLP